MSVAERLQLYSVQNCLQCWNKLTSHMIWKHLKKSLDNRCSWTVWGHRGYTQDKKYSHALKTNNRQAKKSWTSCLPAGVWDFQPGLYHKWNEFSELVDVYLQYWIIRQIGIIWDDLMSWNYRYLLQANGGPESSWVLQSWLCTAQSCCLFAFCPWILKKGRKKREW